MSRTPVSYPAALPCPQTMTVSPVERRLLSDASRPRDAAALQRDCIQLERLSFPPMTTAEFAAFRAWWRDDLILGGSWFAADWPNTRGLTTTVRRFLDAPSWQFIPGGFFQISALCEVRGVGELPTRFESDASLLMLFEAQDGDQAFVDSIAGRVFTLQRNAGDFGSAAIEPAITTGAFKFGGSSCNFPSNVGYHLVLQNGDFCNFGTGDFTIECFIRNQGDQFGSLPFFWIDNVGGVLLPTVSLQVEGASGNLTAFLTADGQPSALQLSAAGVITGADWHHVSVQRQGTSLELHVDGSRVDFDNTQISAGDGFFGTQTAGYYTRIGSGGQANSGQFRGQIDSLRITPGFALYGTTYTVPTSELR